jgi:hypothetical protein
MFRRDVKPCSHPGESRRDAERQFKLTHPSDRSLDLHHALRRAVFGARARSRHRCCARWTSFRNEVGSGKKRSPRAQKTLDRFSRTSIDPRQTCTQTTCLSRDDAAGATVRPTRVADAPSRFTRRKSVPVAPRAAAAAGGPNSSPSTDDHRALAGPHRSHSRPEGALQRDLQKHSRWTTRCVAGQACSALAYVPGLYPWS